MSAIGDDAPSGGFTLFEMLVVLAILGLIGGIVYPAIGRAQRVQTFGAAAAAVTGALRDGRGRALRQDMAVAVRGESLPMPDTLHLATVPARGILFFPDGSSSGGLVTLTDGVRRLAWRIAPVSGAMAVSAG